jgi:hypothetical protein
MPPRIGTLADATLYALFPGQEVCLVCLPPAVRVVALDS